MNHHHRTPLQSTPSGDRTVDAEEFSELFRQLLPHASDTHIDRAWHSVLDLERSVGGGAGGCKGEKRGGFVEGVEGRVC